jgi:hypothetical protein
MLPRVTITSGLHVNAIRTDGAVTFLPGLSRLSPRLRHVDAARLPASDRRE